MSATSASVSQPSTHVVVVTIPRQPHRILLALSGSSRASPRFLLRFKIFLLAAAASSSVPATNKLDNSSINSEGGHLLVKSAAFDCSVTFHNKWMAYRRQRFSRRIGKNQTKIRLKKNELTTYIVIKCCSCWASRGLHHGRIGSD